MKAYKQLNGLRGSFTSHQVKEGLEMTNKEAVGKLQRDCRFVLVGRKRVQMGVAVDIIQSTWRRIDG